MVDTHTEILVNAGTSKESLPDFFATLIPDNHRNWRIPWRSIRNARDRKVSQEGKAIILGNKTTGCEVLEF